MFAAPAQPRLQGAAAPPFARPRPQHSIFVATAAMWQQRCITGPCRHMAIAAAALMPLLHMQQVGKHLIPLSAAANTVHDATPHAMFFCPVPCRHPCVMVVHHVIAAWCELKFLFVILQALTHHVVLHHRQLPANGEQLVGPKPFSKVAVPHFRHVVITRDPSSGETSRPPLLPISSFGAVFLLVVRHKL